MTDIYTAARLALEALEEMKPTSSTVWHRQVIAITALREALAAPEAQHEQITQLQEQNAVLDTKLAEIEKDAARYRWLKEGNDTKHSKAMQIASHHFGLEWDDLIDKAMEAE